MGNSSDAETESRPVVQAQPSDLSNGSTGLPEQFHEGERDGASLFGIVSVIQNLVIVGLIVVVVTLRPRECWPD